MHRVGRTGRAGAKGRAVTFFTSGLEHTLPRERPRTSNSVEYTSSSSTRHAVFLVCRSGDAKKAHALVEILKESQQDIPPELQRMATHMGDDGGSLRYSRAGGGGGVGRYGGGGGGGDGGGGGSSSSNGSSSGGRYSSSSGGRYTSSSSGGRYAPSSSSNGGAL